MSNVSHVVHTALRTHINAYKYKYPQELDTVLYCSLKTVVLDQDPIRIRSQCQTSVVVSAREGVALGISEHWEHFRTFERYQSQQHSTVQVPLPTLWRI